MSFRLKGLNSNVDTIRIVTCADSLIVRQLHANSDKPSLSTQPANDSTRRVNRPIVIAAATTAICSLLAWQHYRERHTQQQLVDTLRPDEFCSLPLASVKPLTSDTYLFTFSLAKPATTPLTPIWSVFLKDDTLQTARHYTPVYLPPPGTPIDKLQLAVRVYSDGQVSRFIANKNIGDRIEFIGPRLNSYKWQYQPNKYRHVLLMAGGTGVAPMVQLLQYAMIDTTDSTQFTLIFAAKNEQDHLLADTLNELAQQYPNRLRIRYLAETLESISPSAWTGGIGRITKTEIEKASIWQGGDLRASLAIVCGPPGMMEQVAGRMRSEVDPGPVGGLLAQLGFETPQVIKL
ncbi:hypothetical protein BDF19DRAFT_387529 [Syncephalis fuscata]|nr:hypothetical protein BDF19DRAFT_387529 [Syncephalis fuscata]